MSPAEHVNGVAPPPFKSKFDSGNLNVQRASSNSNNNNHDIAIELIGIAILASGLSHLMQEAP